MLLCYKSHKYLSLIENRVSLQGKKYATLIVTTEIHCY